MSISDFRGVAVLVTGGAGFIGSHLVDALLERGAQVRVLDNLATGKRQNLAHVRDRVDLLEDDLRDLDACRRACAGTTLVFHQGALGSVPRSLEDPATTIAVNVTGTANLFAAARDAGVERIVYASSSSVYGGSTGLPKREGEEGRPLSPYALSKVMNEELADIFGRCFGLELVGLRYFNVFGPRQDPAGPYAAVIPRFFQQCLRGEPPAIDGDGEQTRDFTFVADAVTANLLAAGAPARACGSAYNVGAGCSTSVAELARSIRDLVGDVSDPVHGPARRGDVRHSLADLSRVSQALGFAPAFDLVRGLQRTRHDFGDIEGRTRHHDRNDPGGG